MAARRNQELAAKLGHAFRRPQLLHDALTHPGATPGRTHTQFERLEFLGDRVLGLAVARMLFDRFPHETEGDLSRRHAALVRRETLAKVARGLGLNGMIQCAPAEGMGNGSRDNPGILADACEAVLGALFADGGLEAAERLVRACWTPLVEGMRAPPRDAKTALQEWAQGRGLPLPAYSEIAREGPPHAPLFVVSVAVAGAPPTSGRGRSKRAAEQAAAGALLEALEQ